MERFLILAQGLIILLMSITFALVVKKRRDDICEMNGSYEYLVKDYHHLSEIIDDISTRYSKCLDDRERLLNESNVRIKKLEIELEKSEMENERLRARLAIIEGAKNEEKEVEKED